MSQSTPGTLCLRTRIASGSIYLSAGVLYLGSLSALGIQIKSARSTLGPQTKSTQCAPRHEITTFLLIFNCRLKMKGLSFLFVLV